MIRRLYSKNVKNPPKMQETLVRLLGWKHAWSSDRLPIPVFLGFPGGSDGKESACNVEVLGSVPGLGRSSGDRSGDCITDLVHDTSCIAVHTVCTVP